MAVAPAPGQGVEARPVKGGPARTAAVVKGEEKTARASSDASAVISHTGPVARAASPRSWAGAIPTSSTIHHRWAPPVYSHRRHRMEPTAWMEQAPSIGCPPSCGAARWTTPDDTGVTPLHRVGSTQCAVEPDRAHPVPGSGRWLSRATGVEASSASASMASTRATPPSAPLRAGVFAGTGFLLDLDRGSRRNRQPERWSRGTSAIRGTCPVPGCRLRLRRRCPGGRWSRGAAGG